MHRPMALKHMSLWFFFSGMFLVALYAGGFGLLVTFAESGFGDTPIEVIVTVAYGFVGAVIFGAIFGSIPGFILGFINGVILAWITRNPHEYLTRDDLLILQKRAVRVITSVNFIGFYVVGFIFFGGEVIRGEVIVAIFIVVLPSIIVAAMTPVVVRRYFVKLSKFAFGSPRKAKAKNTA